MTKIIAALVLFMFPVIWALMRAYPRRRPWAFVALGALPFLTNWPVTGFIYGWPGWTGYVRGIGFPLIDALALALIATRRRETGVLPFWGLFAFYGFTLFASIIFSALWVSTVFACWQFLLVVLVFAAVGGEAHRPDLRHGLLIGLALGLCYEAAYVLPQKFSGVVQASGTMGHQNILGLMIELSVTPLIAALLAGNREKLLTFGVAAALICVASTGSRGTLGIVTGALIVLTLLSLARHATARKLTVAALSALVLAILTPFAFSTLDHRFKGASYVTQEAERNGFERAARAMSSDYPFGVGANQFVYVSNMGGYAAAQNIAWQASDRSVPVHNAYLLARAETGWLGELAFILLLIWPTSRAIHFAFANRRAVDGQLALGIGIALAANMVHDNIEFAVHTFPVETLVAINLGIIAGLVRERRTVQRRMRSASRNEQAERRRYHDEAANTVQSLGGPKGKHDTAGGFGADCGELGRPI